MRNKRYRRRHRLNAVKIFLVTVLFLVFLGFIVSQRSRNIEAERERQAQQVSETEKENGRDSEDVMKKILADETRYP